MTSEINKNMSFYLLRLKNYRYFIGLAIGISIVILHAVLTLQPLMHLIDGDQFWFTPYTEWISFNVNGWTILFYLSIPLLSSLSAAQLMIDDLQSGFLWQIINRMNYIKYIGTIQIISFLSGAITILIPLALDYFIFWCFTPNLKANFVLNANHPLLGQTTFFANYYYTQPFKLVIFYLLFSAVLGGLYALFSSTLASCINNRFVSLATGFVLTMILNVLSAAFPHISLPSPVLIAIGSSPVYLPGIVPTIFVIATVLLLLIVIHTVGVNKRIHV